MKPDAEILDYEVLDGAAEILKKKFPSVVSAYIADARGYLGGIEKGLNDGDLRMIAQNAHPLKSASEGLGVMNVFVLARDLEARARDAAAGGGDVSVAALSPAADSVRSALECAIPMLHEYMARAG